jgi:hypothetical protein
MVPCKLQFIKRKKNRREKRRKNKANTREGTRGTYPNKA